MFLHFLSVTNLRVMSHYAHDMGLMSMVVEGVFHGLAIDCQGILMCSPDPIPVIERPIRHVRFSAYQAIAHDRQARNHIMPVLTSTAEAFAGFLSQAVGSNGYGFVAAHTTQDSARRQTQHHRQTVAPSLLAALIGHGVEAQRQRAHLFGIEHNLGSSCELKVFLVRIG
jgi:hypothetical protein